MDWPSLRDVSQTDGLLEDWLLNDMELLAQSKYIDDQFDCWYGDDQNKLLLLFFYEIYYVILMITSLYFIGRV